jgi:hypothetical protein
MHCVEIRPALPWHVPFGRHDHPHAQIRTKHFWGHLVAILTFSRRANALTTTVVADQMVRLHGVDAPEFDQTFW